MFKSKQVKSIIFIFIFFTCFFISTEIVLAQPSIDQFVITKQAGSVQSNSGSQQYNEFKFQKDLIDQVISYNLGYLGVALTIILAATGLFYLFSVKPLKDDINEQKKNVSTIEEKLSKTQERSIEISEERLVKQITSLKEDALKLIDLVRNENKDDYKKLKDEFENKINENIKVSNEKINLAIKSADSKIDSSEKRFRELEMDSLWMQHYVWKIGKIYTNAFDCLMEYLEKGLEYKVTYLFDLCLNVMDEVLGKLESSEYLSQEDYERLQNIFSRIDKHDDQKAKVLRVAKLKIKNN